MLSTGVISEEINSEIKNITKIEKSLFEITHLKLSRGIYLTTDNFLIIKTASSSTKIECYLSKKITLTQEISSFFNEKNIRLSEDNILIISNVSSFNDLSLKEKMKIEFFKLTQEEKDNLVFINDKKEYLDIVYLVNNLGGR
ncbi:MAG: hypothetical protein KGV57_02300 [Fusobacterium sp.]|nr:hypothetical protein [Fusobacterium sp.]